MDDDDLQEVSELLGVELDDTIILLFLRGEYSDELTVEKQDSLEVLSSRVQFKSIFKQVSGFCLTIFRSSLSVR